MIEPRLGGLGGQRHLSGHFGLIPLAIAAPIAKDDRVETLGCGRGVGGQQASGKAGAEGGGSGWPQKACERIRGESVS